MRIVEEGDVPNRGGGFDFHIGDDRTPAIAKASQGGSERAGEKKKMWGDRRAVGAEWQQRAGLWQDEAGEHAEGGGDVRAQLLADMRFRLRLGAIRRRWCSGNWDKCDHMEIAIQ